VSGGGRQSLARPELGWSGPNDWAGAEKNKGKMNQEGLGLEMFFTPTLNGKNFFAVEFISNFIHGFVIQIKLI
jgi:hypothetical protein